MDEQSRDTKESHMRLAHATPLAISNERTNERTYVDTNTDCDILQLSDARARVKTNRIGVESDAPRNPSITPNTPGLIRLARAELEAAKANHCTHGVPLTVCRDHHAAATDQPDQEEA